MKTRSPNARGYDVSYNPDQNPVSLHKLPSGKYRVSTPNQIHAKNTTYAKAKAQEKIINAADHGIYFTKKKKKHKR